VWAELAVKPTRNSGTDALSSAVDSAAKGKWDAARRAPCGRVVARREWLQRGGVFSSQV
jgi:hypothetical protein